MAVWLAAAVVANVIVALLTHGGTRERLFGPLLPAPLLAGKSDPDRWMCAAWGPFSDTAAIDALIARIEAVGGETDVIPGWLGAGPDYVLLVGPQGSFEAARRVREEFGSQAIDSHVVRSGAFATSLEVGVFADRLEALARQARIEDLGYVVELRELERSAPAFYLVARLHSISSPELPPAGDCGAVAPGHRFL